MSLHALRVDGEVLLSCGVGGVLRIAVLSVWRAAVAGVIQEKGPLFCVVGAVVGGDDDGLFSSS